MYVAAKGVVCVNDGTVPFAVSAGQDLPAVTLKSAKIHLIAAFATTTSPIWYWYQRGTHLHLMPVQMPWMTCRTRVVNDEPHSLIRSHVINIPIIIYNRIGSVSTLRQ